MARIKAEVKEQRQVRLHALKPEAASPSPAVALHAPPPPLVELPPAAADAHAREFVVVGDAPQSTTSCIDLTADDDTEDEEDADEPFVPTLTPTPTTSQIHIDSSPVEETAIAREVEVEVHPERSLGNEEEKKEIEAEEGAEEDQAVAGGFLLSPGEDESEVDEEMPQSRAPTDTSSGVSILDRADPPVTSGGGELLPGAGDDESTDDETDRPEASSALAMDGEEMEEEDELWPALPPPIVDHQTGSKKDVEDGEPTASERGESTEETHSMAVNATTDGRLEDGEIFEEGAEIKSPTAVKEAIAQELEAARAAAAAAGASKKKQKKRGRKKNKRKLEMMAAAEEEHDLDGFGRNVRHQPVGAVQASALGDFLPLLSAQGAAAPSLPLVQLPPLLGTPPLPPLPPPLPTNDYAMARNAQLQFQDDEIVRVNRHGGFEPFQFHGSGSQQPPIFPPPPMPMNGGFRYVTMDHFSNGRADTPVVHTRGLKRPLPPSFAEKQSDEGGEQDAFDLDSLRAAALKTKKKTPMKEKTPAIAVAAPSAAASPVDAGTTSSSPAEDESSLDSLRMELLKTMGRKRRETSNASATSTTELEVPSSTSGLNGIETRKDGKDEQSVGGEEKSSSVQKTSPPEKPSSLAPKKSLVATNLTSAGPEVPESPQFRPLTAMSQSVIIRLSRDDLAAESRDRADSLDGVMDRLDRANEHSRAAGVFERKPRTSNKRGVESTSVSKNAGLSIPPTVLTNPPLYPTRSVSTSAEHNSLVGTSIPASKNDATTTSNSTANNVQSSEAAECEMSCVEEKTSGGTAQFSKRSENANEQTAAAMTPVSLSVDDEAILADPARLEAECAACAVNIQEADAHIARLDADIAALRLAIAAKEAITSSSSTATACGA